MRSSLALSAMLFVTGWQSTVHAHGFFVVNTTSDHDDGACEEAAAGDCTLREAITAANALVNDHPDAPDSIGFDFGPATEPPFRIVVQSPLPTIIEGAAIDGASEPRYILRSEKVPLVLLEGDGVDELLRVRSDNTLILALGFMQAGVSAIDAENADYLLVRGCYFGIDPQTGAATAARAFGSHAIHVRDTFRARVGGLDDLSRNVVAGAGAQAIHFERADGLLLYGNYVGVDPTGLEGRPNALADPMDFAVDVRSSEGIEVIDNVVSANLGGGIALVDTPAAAVEDNQIGVAVTDGDALGNGGDGLAFGGQIEGTFIQGNVVSSNGGDGVVCTAGATGQWALIGNIVGVDAEQTQVLPNLGHGVSVEAGCDGAAIGTTGLGQGNVIAHNQGAGIRLVDGVGTARGNAIFMNGALGIDAGEEGVTDNDPGDALLPVNFPEVQEMSTVDGMLMIAGCTVEGAALDVYEAAADPSGFGEGMRHLGAMAEGGPLDGSSATGCSPENDAAFAMRIDTDAAAITLTATHRGRTSEFSPVFVQQGGEPEPSCEVDVECEAPTPVCNPVLQRCEVCLNDAEGESIDTGCTEDAPRCVTSPTGLGCAMPAGRERERESPAAGRASGGCSVRGGEASDAGQAFTLLLLLGLLRCRDRAK